MIQYTLYPSTPLVNKLNILSVRMRGIYYSTLFKRKNSPFPSNNYFMKTSSDDNLISQLNNIRIQVAAFLRQLEIAIDVERQNITFAKGDQVRITNRVRLPRGRTVTETDRYTTVTGIIHGTNKIHFTTDNVTKT